MNAPVNFKLAKLLKEKGFDELCTTHWEWGNGDKKNGHLPSVFIGGFVDDEGNSRPYRNSELMNTYSDNEGDIFGEFCRPTIAEVVMWLYEKHGIWISIDMVYEEDQTGFWYCIRESKIDDVAVQSEEYNSPTEAYEAAIGYVLTNLI